MSAPPGVVVWFTGLPSSGKSTLARAAADALRARGLRDVCVLDGDEVRAALVPAPGYDPDGRDHFYDTLSNLAALLARQGLAVLVAATAHRRAFRDRARERAPRFVEVHVRVDPSVATARDAKRLYAAQRAGEVSNLPGADAGYEPPERPDVVADGGLDLAAVDRVVERALDPAHDRVRAT